LPICPTYLPEHSLGIPRSYIKNYADVPPLWLVTVGYSKVGKTTYLAYLTLILEKMACIWSDMYYRPLDQFTMSKIQEIRIEAKDGRLPQKTEKVKANDNEKKHLIRPLLLSVQNLPDAGSRSLVMYDVAGETYDSLYAVQRFVKSVKQVQTTWFFVSPFERDEDGKLKTTSRSLTDLFSVYLTGMENLRIDLKDRNLIVVFTKGDLCINPKLRSYLLSDPFRNLFIEGDENYSRTGKFDMKQYFSGMKHISEVLEEYTQDKIPGGAAFINMVRSEGMNLVFSITSALGRSPSPKTNELKEDPKPSRVLDPFLWAIEMDKPYQPKPLGIILDGTHKSRSLYSEGLVEEIWDELADYGEVTVYYLGQSNPCCLPGQEPPNSPPAVDKHRFIGPILDQASKDKRFIIISTGHITDLEDFNSSYWYNRLVLVNMGENTQKNWPKVEIYRSGMDTSLFIHKLLD
jgi:hypothetical protein